MWVTPSSPSRIRVRSSSICSGGQAREQMATLAEEHGDDVQLDLVEDARGKCQPRGSGAVDQHVLVARSLLGPSHRGRDVVQVGHQRPLRYVDAGLIPGEDEDRRAVVVVTAEAAGRLEGPPA